MVERFSFPKIYFSLPENFNKLDSTQQDEIIGTLHNEILERDKSHFQAKIYLSSMVGEALGSATFFKVNEYFINKHKKKHLKCWKRFCLACSEYHLEITDSIDHHLVETTITNIKHILKLGDFQWRWDNPESEWALKWSDPNKWLSHILSEKLNPVCRVSIESLDFAIAYINQSQKTKDFYRAIIRNESKKESGLVLTEADSVLWNKIEAEIKQKLGDQPRTIADVPWDWADD